MILKASILLTVLSKLAVANISTVSTSGRKLLSNARRMDEEYDFSWVADYSIKFTGCHNIIQFEGGGGGEEEGKVRSQGIARFQLCPSNTCSRKSCSKGGEYLSEMDRFLQAYVEAKAEQLENACEYVQENCDCENANDDDACLNQCYIDSGLEDCIEYDNDDDGEQFDLADYMDCKEIGDNDDDSVQYFVGPKCSGNGKNVYLGVFTNERCTTEATDGEEIYKSIVGKSLPYSSSPIIEHDCIDCMQVANNDDDDNVEVNEMCEEVYEEAAKCEKNMDIDYPNTQDCDFMHNTIKRLDASYKGPVVSRTFAWVFCATTIALAVYAFTIHKKLERSSVKLNDGAENLGEMS